MQQKTRGLTALGLICALPVTPTAQNGFECAAKIIIRQPSQKSTYFFTRIQDPPLQLDEPGMGLKVAAIEKSWPSKRRDID